uniref:Cytochrome P450 monooxygenase nodR n=1 Tax=Hypoxylon pulicicidum TaxID=1243767 RepID=NODR_HYPPI|nr:RecName: Full=Cytochrome P450 monooxygenase nodR; AltName: Full=Nodulisporic acid biosynthesis cluster protein R [Hypoxylon pulicicidum]AUM60066.1 cytochrome P450 oxygenase [Hypoxylon pulicicidum]
MFDIDFGILFPISWEQSPIFLAVGLIFAFATLSPWLRSGERLINGREGFEILWTNAKKRYQTKGRSVMEAGFSKYNDSFYMMTDSGTEMVLHPRYVDEIRNDPRLDFHRYMKTKGGEINRDLIQTKLTRSVGRLIGSISAEIEDALHNRWEEGEGEYEEYLLVLPPAEMHTEWHEIVLLSVMIPVVAQGVSKMFVGDPLCRNKDWIGMILRHTRSVQTALRSLRLWPYFLRPLAARFLPTCRQVTAEIEEARRIINPVLEKKRAEKLAMIQKGEKPPEPNTYMDWLEESDKDEFYDPVVAQLKISMAAIHATSDLLSQTIFSLCDSPELVKELRAEAVSVIGAYGWGKEAIYNLKLMDSVLKETQRLKPMQINLTRLALDRIKLSDGTVIPRGSKVLISCHNMWDSNVYPNANQYDGHRFYKLRQRAGMENSAQLSTPSPDHLGFGLGMYACPGRHIASTVMKVTLCHILLKYDFELAEGCTPRVIEYGSFLLADPTARVSIRRRKEEIQL